MKVIEMINGMLEKGKKGRARGPTDFRVGQVSLTLAGLLLRQPGLGVFVVIGVGHNFYWIVKPTGVIALGSVFSTTQVWFIFQKHDSAVKTKELSGSKITRNDTEAHLKTNEVFAREPPSSRYSNQTKAVRK